MRLLIDAVFVIFAICCSMLAFSSEAARPKQYVLVRQAPNHQRRSIDVQPGETISVNFVSRTPFRDIEMSSMPRAHIYLVPFHRPVIETLNYVQLMMMKSMARFRKHAASGVKDSQVMHEYMKEMQFLKKKVNLKTILVTPLRKFLFKTGYSKMLKNYGSYKVRECDIPVGKVDWKNAQHFSISPAYTRTLVPVKIPKEIKEYSDKLYEFGVRMLGPGIGGEYINYGVAHETLRLQKNFLDEKEDKLAEQMKSQGLLIPPRHNNGLDITEQPLKPNTVVIGRNRGDKLILRVSLAGLPKISDPSNADINNVFMDDFQRYTFSSSITFPDDEGKAIISLTQSKHGSTLIPYEFQLSAKYEPPVGKKKPKKYQFFHDYRMFLLRPLAFKTEYAMDKVEVWISSDDLGNQIFNLQMKLLPEASEAVNQRKMQLIVKDQESAAVSQGTDIGADVLGSRPLSPRQQE